MLNTQVAKKSIWILNFFFIFWNYNANVLQEDEKKLFLVMILALNVQ